MRWYLRSKIYRATITEATVNYMGSITIDVDLIEQAGFKEGEKVAIWDITNGERFETYIINGKRGSGIVCINGVTAKKIKKGHKVIIAGFELSDNKLDPTIISVNERNRFIEFL